MVGRDRRRFRGGSCAPRNSIRSGASRRLRLFRFPRPFGGVDVPAGAAPSRPPGIQDRLLFLLAAAGPVTAQCRASADIWVDAWQMSDDELADRIQADQVDILVDLSGHSAGNRLRCSRASRRRSRSPLGAATGTGLPTIDYFFADPVTVPQAGRHLFAEEVYDLPAVITTDPLPDAQPTPLPMLRNGHVTFGVFNRIDKISDQALAVWSRLMPSCRTHGSSSRTARWTTRFCATA